MAARSPRDFACFGTLPSYILLWYV
jgi:hypothetical protein